MFGLLSTTSPQAFTPIGIGTDVLAGWYGARASAAALAGQGAQLSGASSGAFDAKSDVLPPWDVGAPPSPSEELARRALASGDFLDTDTYEGYSDTDAPQDQKQLFALHQALKKLHAIAEEATNRSTLDTRRAFLDRRFQEGMTEIADYLATATFDGVNVVHGVERTSASSGISIPRGKDIYRTGVLHEGDFDAEVDAFQGARAFTITANKSSGPVVVDIDLADMGATPRSLDNVADLINTKLEAAGLFTRFKRVKIGEPDENGVVPGSRFGFEIEGIYIEPLEFSAPASASAAIYLAGTSGTSGEDSVTAGQITKVSGLGAGAPSVESSVRWETIESEAEANGLTISSAQVGPDGGVYVLGTTDLAAADGPSLRGDKDVVLAKYDSTGHQVWSRALGAAESADGHALTVGADGSVTVAGAISGALGETIEHGQADGFVARFDADGVEQWLHRLGGVWEDSIDAVTVGADGTVYVAGRTRSSLSGDPHGGGADAFVRALDADGATLWTRQFGDADDERATAIAVADDGDLIVTSVENGEGFVRKFTSADGASPATWSHALGDLDEGSISAVHADASGIYLVGAARSGMTLAGSPVAHAGGRDAFVIALDDGASPSVRFETWLGSSAEDVARDVVVSGGAVYVAGYTDGDLPSGGALSGTRNAFAARLDASTGALDWTTQVTGRGGVSQGASLTLDASGASDLDAFGLPSGTLTYQDDRAIAQRTSARAGDYFYISVNGGRKRKIEIDADDTLRALTFKINAALVLDGEAKVSRGATGDELKITPKPGASFELLAGGEGRDLLAALGLEPGKVAAPSDEPEVEEIKAFALELSGGLNITGRTPAEEALKAIDAAMSSVRDAYRYLTRDPALDELLNGALAKAGPPPAYLVAKIANYQNALARLSGL